MNIVANQINQFKRDLETDAAIVPSKWKRYTAYLSVIIGASLVIYDTRNIILTIPACIGLLLLFAGTGWFIRATYNYIRQKEQ